MRVYRSIITETDFSKALHFGSGRDKRHLGSELSSADREVIALDPDPHGLEQNDTPKRVLGDGQRLPFADNTFDLVFSEYVFEHLPEPELALREINRVLEPGGAVVILVPNPKHYYAKIADLTPFWFHHLWFSLQGNTSADEDKFPTQFEWGTYTDIQSGAFDWEIERLYSFPGPTGYTKILPVHFLFTLFDRAMKNRPQHHVAYLVYYQKQE
ncbi:methyltransferase [Natrialba hulunbeirensis JCM 10989]|uniref:Methyltransferase n=1 Tax=Natrialba hulunbeirensis JCM 10989 TaxID=1227493 RepID=M0AAI2_9EURY|nr:class I SAM-dependent methyltransferase [Natrialba hulunbeirensis]ELY95770.1 methyltransferase [Natrialba hulunbeirensis JCM 10989]